jgi:hypothetical protein
MKIFLPLYKAYFYRRLMQPGQIDLEIIGAHMAKFEDMNGDGAFSSADNIRASANPSPPLLPLPQ